MPKRAKQREKTLPRKTSPDTERPPRRSRHDRPLLSRKIIVQAAFDILDSEGADKVNMRNIAAHVNCSVAGPYSYFDSLDEIVLAVIKEGEERLASTLRKARATKTGFFDQMTLLLRTYRNWAKRNRELHRLMFSKGGPGRTHTWISPSYKVYFETLRDAVRDGTFQYSRAGYHRIARAMWSWGYGLVVLDLGGAFDRAGMSNDPIDEGIELFYRLLREGEKETPTTPPRTSA